MALHFHGHKTTVTDYDGVKLAPGAQITRDVFDISAAQRLDLHLQTVNDGLHSYGPGIWLFHDHVETGVTTDGMSPGGNNAIIAYRSLIDEQGMPKVRKDALGQLFNKNYYAKKLPVWGGGDFAALLGDPGFLAPNYIILICFGLSVGLAFGLIIIVFRRFQQNNHD